MRKTFVVQREVGGRRAFVLQLNGGSEQRAWKIARGPTLDPTVRRIASATDPLSTNTGVEVWDEGSWSTPNQARNPLDGDEINFALKGTKLHGAFTLRRGPSQWSLIKQDDDFAIVGADAAAIDEAFATVNKKQRAPSLSFMPLTLATLADAPPEGPGWTHEVKLDGYRIEALVEGSAVRLMSRNAKDWTERFPQVVRELQQLNVQSAVLDGEIVSVNAGGVSSFQQLQQSLDQSTPEAIRYFVFDLLALDGEQLVRDPLEARLPVLAKVLGRRAKGALVQPVARFDLSRGNVLDQACRAGEEGVISKRLDARYIPGRSRIWIKSKCGKRQEFVIVGYTDPQGSRNGFGSLLLAVNDAEGLRYAGRVGTGFDTALLDSLYRKLRHIETATNPLIEKPAGVVMRTVHWVKPVLVAEIAFTEWTDEGLLRHPSFKGLREDKSPSDVRREKT